jgi:isopentenyl-diphosphate delta-isomerase
MLGYYDGLPKINFEEVASWKWISLEKVKKHMKKNPEHNTAWFKIIYERFYNYIKSV